MAATYPKVTAKAWSVLRARAVAAPTTKFTPSVVAPLLGMASPTSARDNTVTPLRKLGLLEEDGSLTARGNKWRVDSSFAQACQEIVDDVYPDELASFTGEDGAPDVEKIKIWFDHQGFGESSAKQMAATYVMIAAKQMPDAPNAEPKTQKTTTKKQASKKKKQNEHKTLAADRKPVADEPGDLSYPPGFPGPRLHLDIQIHIPADASAEQIDQIFASMARHLYPK